jgi:hypothetical protein
MSFDMDNMPEPSRDLQYFSPLVDWVLGIVRRRLFTLGVKDPDSLAVEYPSKQIPPSTSYPGPVGAEVDTVALVVEQVGWLTWHDYLYLIAASRCGGRKTALALYHWARDGNELDKYLDFLRCLMEVERKLRPFKAVFELVIKRFLLEVEMRKKFKSTVEKRYRDFCESGRSLNFGWEDIELESKETAPRNTRKDGKGDIAQRDTDEGLLDKKPGGFHVGVS